VAEAFLRRAGGAQRALVEGVAGLVWAPHGKPRVVFRFTIAGGKVAQIDLVGDTEEMARLDLEILRD
jgi:RNA polymerase sigma-70 factor (ECF subfamily)